MGYDGFVKLINSTAEPPVPSKPQNSTNGTLVYPAQVNRLDVSKDGSMSLAISATEPCYLTLINNNKQAALNWTIAGTNVSADIMRLSFPFNTTKEQKVRDFT